MKLTTKARKNLGKRASAYVERHSTRSRGGGLLVADMYETPDGIARTLTRILGRPTTRSGGEVAYWDCDELFAAEDER